MTRKEGYWIATLGCDKNTVDSERMAWRLERLGLRRAEDAEGARFVIVNTCAFIEDATRQSVDAILEAERIAQADPDSVDIIVTGCLGERYAKDLLAQIPAVSLVSGSEAYDEVTAFVAGKLGTGMDLSDDDGARDGRTRDDGTFHAYLKISEGCDKACAFCIVPTLRGPQRSRDIESLVKEAAGLAAGGARELVIVAQDSGAYGTDLYGERKLVGLLEALETVEGIDWIRLLYMYPENVTPEVISFLAKSNKTLPYLDIPMQHASDRVLAAMRRPSTRASLCALIDELRERVAGIAIRSTFIVGFPGETDEDVEILAGFLSEKKLDRVGVFAYSREEGTPAYSMPNQVRKAQKQRRLDRIMGLAESLSSENLARRVPCRLEVLVEGEEEEGLYSGRSYLDAPEVDGAVFFTSTHPLACGQMVQVLVTDSTEHDLYGEVTNT